MRKFVVTYGLIAGAMLSAMMLLTLSFQEQLGFDKGAIVGYATMVAAFLMVWYGVRAYRDATPAGHLTFGQAFLAGLLITVIASSCYVATWEVIFYKLTPDFAEKFSAHVIEAAKASGASAAEVAKKTQEMAEFQVQYRKPLVNIAYTFLEPLPVGLLFTVVTAWRISRRRKERAAVSA